VVEVEAEAAQGPEEVVGVAGVAALSSWSWAAPSSWSQVARSWLSS
jgi:hypothetical protein